MSELRRVMTPPACPQRPDDGHKGTFGTVIVVGGCATMMGAPALCASAALRGGAGLVKVAAADDVMRTAITIEPGATGILLRGDANKDVSQLEQAIGGRSVVLAVGPGLGQGEHARLLLPRLLEKPWAMVLDADGLNLLAAMGLPVKRGDAPLILTPHPGEFARLAKPLRIANPEDEPQRMDAAAALARAHQAIVALKGRRTVVSDGRRVYVNSTGNAALATAGTGDVLTGLAASLLVQAMAPFDAAVLAVYLHGLAGDLWAQQHGPSGLTARDLAGLLPKAFHQHRGH